MSRASILAAAVFAAVLLAGGAGAANASTYTFSQLTSASKAKPTDDIKPEVEDSGNAAATYTFSQLIGASKTEPTDQFKLEVAESGKDAVSFTFYNHVGEKSSITDIYVAGTDGLLLVPGKITAQSSGVDFSIGADPSDLPVGKIYGFEATAGADSNAPVMKNGVDSSKEYVTWTFALASGVSVDKVIGAIDAGDLRFGLRAPGFSGGSASFINSCGIESCSGSFSTAAIPLPASLWLMFSAMGGLAVLSRRTRRPGGPDRHGAMPCA